MNDLSFKISELSNLIPDKKHFYSNVMNGDTISRIVSLVNDYCGTSYDDVHYVVIDDNTNSLFVTMFKSKIIESPLTKIDDENIKEELSCGIIDLLIEDIKVKIELNLIDTRSIKEIANTLFEIAQKSNHKSLDFELHDNTILMKYKGYSDPFAYVNVDRDIDSCITYCLSIARPLNGTASYYNLMYHEVIDKFKEFLA